ncbi:MAG: ketopantoate reductase family protein [Betaproteobacteria bacterium]
MNFVIVGAGGVGGNLGARLAEAGHRVAWLVRGRTLEALRKGLELKSPLGDLSLGPQIASDDPAQLGPAEAVVVTVKLYDLAELAPKLKALDNAVFLPLENGVDARGMLQAALPGSRVLNGMVSTKSYIEAPGRIMCKSGFSRIRLGGPGAAELAAALNSSKGVEAAVSDNIDRDVWRKFVMLVSMASTTCMHRVTIGQVREDPKMFARLMEGVNEAIAIAEREGVRFGEDPKELVMDQIKDMPRDGKPSMLEDLEADRPLEVDYFSGTIVRLGKKHGVPTPYHSAAMETLSK